MVLTACPLSGSLRMSSTRSMARFFKSVMLCSFSIRTRSSVSQVEEREGLFRVSFMNRLLAICFKKVISFISFMSSVSFCMESGCRFRMDWHSCSHSLMWVL